MNLTELQSELRSISKRMNDLEMAVEQMKPKSEDEKANEYRTITDLASKYPIIGRGLDTVGENTQSMYLKVLAGMALAEEEYLQERILYVTRIAAGIGEPSYSAEQIVELGTKFDVADMENFGTDIEPVRDNFLVDAFMVANICGGASERILGTLAELATLLDCDAECIFVLTTISKGLLTDDFEFLEKMEENFSYQWRGKYLLIAPEKWLIEHRICCGRYCIGHELPFIDSNSTPKCDVKFKLNQGTIVKKGTKLVSFKEEFHDIVMPAFYAKLRGDEKQEKTIFALADGVVYYIRDDIKNKVTGMIENFVMVYVVSRFDNYDAFCEWYQDLKTRDEERSESGGNIAD